MVKIVDQRLEFTPSREGIDPPEKAIPPDKTAGPWLPRKSKSTGRANVGESPWEEYVRRVRRAKVELRYDQGEGTIRIRVRSELGYDQG